MKKFSNILWGLLLILAGVIIALNSFGITDIRVLSANALDIVGNNVEAILQDAISRIPDII